jgi:hypothetical protein
MSAIAYIFLGAAVAIGGTWLWDQFWSFRAQSPADYAAERPAFDLPSALSGEYTAHGAIFDYTGRANVRFAATLTGSFDETGGTLSERFSYDGSNTADTRQWQISFTGPDRFTATAADVVGTAEGVVSGNAVRMTYRLRLPERAGGHVLNVVDWLYLMEDGTIINRSDMRKFGFKAAELFAVFRRPAGESN